MWQFCNSLRVSITKTEPFFTWPYFTWIHDTGKDSMLHFSDVIAAEEALSAGVGDELLKFGTETDLDGILFLARFANTHRMFIFPTFVASH